MGRFGRAAAKRWTTTGTALALIAGASAFAPDCLAASPKVPLPKPRPIARNAAPKMVAAAVRLTPPTSTNSAVPAPVIPAARQHAAVPPAPRKQIAPPVLAATSSTSQADTDA